MNIYTHRFVAMCASNKRRVQYTLRIEAQEMVMVEDLQAFLEGLKEGYHEAFADALFARFGGVQTLDAHHHGTDIRTERP
jgi:hypothetical protein